MFSATAVERSATLGNIAPANPPMIVASSSSLQIPDEVKFLFMSTANLGRTDAVLEMPRHSSQLGQRVFPGRGKGTNAVSQ